MSERPAGLPYDLLEFRLAKQPKDPRATPLILYTAGMHEQRYLSRPRGYSVTQIFVTTSGKGAFHFFDYGSLTLEPGYALLVPASIPHEYFPVGDDPWFKGYVGFSGSLTDALLDTLGFLSLTIMKVNDLDIVMSALDKVWRLTDLTGDRSYNDASVGVYEFLLTLRKQTLAEPDAIRPGPGNKLGRRAVQAAVTIFHERYHERLSIARVARSLGYSRQHFARMFRSVYGVTPHQYLERTRLQEAGRLLEANRDMLVQEVAQQVGFDDTSYFIRAFKRFFGLTPKQFPGRTDLMKPAKSEVAARRPNF